MPVTRKLSLLACGVVVLSLAVGVNTASAQTAAANRDDKTKVQIQQPSPAEVKALTEAMQAITSEEDKDLVVVTHKNGMKSVDLKGRFQSVAVAKRNSDGSIAVRCVEDADEGKQFLTSKTSTPKSAQRSKSHKPAEKE